METYDYIIAGGGCAGLSLAYCLASSSLALEKKVLIIESDDKDQNDRTWCFWEGNSSLRHLISHSWRYLYFIDEAGAYKGDLGARPYHMIRGIDFYRHIHQKVDRMPGFGRIRGQIVRLSSDSHRGMVSLEDGREFSAEWVFNSCLREADPPSPNSHFLLQHFKGWSIRTPQPVFKPEEAVLMDFRAEQKDDTRFFYQLPFSANEALIEYTIFSASRLETQEYDEALAQYIQHTLGIEEYEITEVESGAIPMTDQDIKYKNSDRVINIGGLGGAIKPSTGYAFTNIQKQVQQIVNLLSEGKAPDSQRPSPGRFAFYDSLLLNILQYSGRYGKPIFERLFRYNRMRAILNFLGEETHLLQEVKIFATLPIGVFLKALFRWKVRPQHLATGAKPGRTTPSLLLRKSIKTKI